MYFAWMNEDEGHQISQNLILRGPFLGTRVLLIAWHCLDEGGDRNEGYPGMEGMKGVECSRD
jgi:hypothetical protein